MHWLAHLLGVDNASGPIYLLWSGPVGDLGIFAAVAAYLRHRNCHRRGCWRLGRHPIDGTPYVVCAKHHPNDKPGAPDGRHLSRRRPDHQSVEEP